MSKVKPIQLIKLRKGKLCADIECLLNDFYMEVGECNLQIESFRKEPRPTNECRYPEDVAMRQYERAFVKITIKELT